MNCIDFLNTREHRPNHIISKANLKLVLESNIDTILEKNKPNKYIEKYKNVENKKLNLETFKAMYPLITNCSRVGDGEDSTYYVFESNAYQIGLEPENLSDEANLQFATNALDEYSNDEHFYYDSTSITVTSQASTQLLNKVEKLLEYLDDYPILCDDTFNELENEMLEENFDVNRDEIIEFLVENNFPKKLKEYLVEHHCSEIQQNAYSYDNHICLCERSIKDGLEQLSDLPRILQLWLNKTIESL